MRIVMSIHAQWMLGIVDNITKCAESGIPEDYEMAIGSHKAKIIWSVIKIDIHNYVCDLVGLESAFFDCLFSLWKASLLDEACERNMQVLKKHVTQHRLYISSVEAAHTILHDLMPLRTNQARQDKYDTCPCMNSLACWDVNVVLVCH